MDKCKRRYVVLVCISSSFCLHHAYGGQSEGKSFLVALCKLLSMGSYSMGDENSCQWSLFGVHTFGVLIMAVYSELSL